MAQLILLFRDNDHLVELDELTDIVDGSFVNDAAVTADINDLDGNSIASGITLTYVTLSNGKYQGIIQDTLPLVVNTFYTVIITAVKGSTTGTWELPAQCVRRQD